MATDKSKALYDLFRSEKKQEDKTRLMLDDLEQNSAQLQKAKVQLIEKLLDIQVKDEMSRIMEQEDANTLKYLSGVSSKFSQTVSQRRRIDDEIQADVRRARIENPDRFLSKFENMLMMTDEAARSDVASMVGKYLDPHIENYRRKRRSTEAEKQLASIDAACRHVRAERQKKLLEEGNVRERKNANDRRLRVEQATALFKRNLGDIGALLYVVPQEYKTDIGKKEAEINELRRTIMAQRSEEERLVQERQIQISIIDANQSKLSSEVDQLHQKLSLLRRELETKSLEVREMQEASRAGSGAWANNTIQLEKDLALATEEEYHLKQEVEQIKRTNEALLAEKDSYDSEIAEGIDELRKAQAEHQSVLDRLESNLSNGRRTILEYRTEEARLTREMNELRHKMVHRREDIRRQKRNFREKINTVMGQLSIEDHLQSLLMAKSIELQKSIDKTQDQADHHISSLNHQLEKVKTELDEKGNTIRSLAVELSNWFAGLGVVKEIKLSAPQLLTQIDASQREVERLERDAADQVAAIASRIDSNMRENDLTLRQMGWLATLQEDVQSEGVDIGETSTEVLQQLRDTLYSELTQRSYREGKYTQAIRCLRERLTRRQRGESVQPLTLVRRMPLSERRARAEVFERSRQMKETARDHLRQHNVQTQLAQTRVVALQDPSTAEGKLANSQIMAQFRSMIISYIKKEIQPLYDSNQISKARFVDVVHRVSTWYIENHIPTIELSQQNMTVINRKIQEVLTWQDEQRLQMRPSTSSVPSASGGVGL